MLEAGELPNPLATECPIFIGISPNEKDQSRSTEDAGTVEEEAK
jgi:hypothetical protein